MVVLEVCSSCNARHSCDVHQAHVLSIFLPPPPPFPCAQTLAKIHSVDLAKAGLQDYARKPDGYAARQLKTWSGQYMRNREALPVAAMDELASWLPDHLPPQERTTIVHGDYRLDNLVLTDSFDARAVLDWELSTLGDPLCDVAQLCLPYYFDGSIPPLIGIKHQEGSGLPTLADFLGDYCRAAGRPHLLATEKDEQRWRVYMAFTCFRVAAILHGVYIRSTKGQSASEDAARVGRLAEPVANIGLQCMREWERVAAAAHVTIAPLAAGTPAERRRAHVAALKARLEKMMADDVLPLEPVWAEHARSDLRWTIHPSMEEAKAKAKAAGLWNLFMPLESDPSVNYGGSGGGGRREERVGIGVGGGS